MGLQSQVQRQNGVSNSTLILVMKLIIPSSCKHMCCREGIDKAPKAPKNSFISVSSMVDTSHLSGHVSKKGCVATAKQIAALSVLGNEREVEIEMVDLTNGQRLKRFDKLPSKTFRSLDILPENVIKGKTARTAIKKQPFFDYREGEKPETSLLKTDAGTEISSDKPSTDYDADWISELPSPSVLLRKTLEKIDSLAGHISTDCIKSQFNNLQSPSTPIRDNDTAHGVYHDKDLLEGLGLSQFNDDESEIEAAMVGLSDSVAMEETAQVQAAADLLNPQLNTCPNPALPPNKSTTKVYFDPATEGKSSRTSALFFSTDSPERVVELGKKRKADVDDEVENSSELAPVAKRARMINESDQPPRRLSSVESQRLAGTPIVKPGQPAWVYEFDAGFIAEWQDIVDFV